MLSSAIWIAMFFSVMVLSVMFIQHVQKTRTITVPFELLPAPPPLTAAEPPPQIEVNKPLTKAAAGIAVPVPDAKAPEEQTIASQHELKTPEVGTGSAGDSIVVQPPEKEVLPKLNDFVYAEEYPELVTDAKPDYPDIAKEAGVEGTVYLRVLVGKDGRVLDVHIDRGIPMLNDAAMKAARKWVFKPALNNNRPVSVWVSRPVKFSLH